MVGGGGGGGGEALPNRQPPTAAGFMYCNMPVLNFTQGQRIRFHMLALPGEVSCTHTADQV